MLFGLSLGLVVALGVYVSGSRAPQSAAPAAADREAASEADSVAPVAAAAGEPAESRFDFYEILPEFVVVVPEEERVPVRDTAPGVVEEPGRYVLQAGSFTSLGDADRLQASLALLGIESRIQRVTIDDRVYHRVRIGPISDLEQLNRVRRQLRERRIEPLLMKAAE
jgi:cell division protein FtsN